MEYDRFEHGGDKHFQVSAFPVVPVHGFGGVVECEDTHRHEYGEHINHAEDDERRLPVYSVDDEQPQHEQCAKQFQYGGNELKQEDIG